MKKNIRSKISDFLTSEEGRVSTKAPLALGIATGSVLLAQAMLPSAANAHVTCTEHEECEAWEVCAKWCEGVWSVDTCIGVLHTNCVDADHF